jgi:hypothetical protein
MSRDGVVDIATMIRAERYGVRVPVKAKDFCLPQQRPGRSWGPPFLLFNGCRGSFPGVKWPEREVKLFPQINHFSPASAEDKSKWIYTSISPICFHGLEKENFPAAFMRTSLPINNFTDLNSCSCCIWIIFNRTQQTWNNCLFSLLLSEIDFIFIFSKSLDKSSSPNIASQTQRINDFPSLSHAIMRTERLPSLVYAFKMVSLSNLLLVQKIWFTFLQ